MISRVGYDSDDNNIWSPPTSIASNNSNDDICVERRGLEDEQWLLVEGGDHSRGVSWLTIIILEGIFFVWSRNVFLRGALRRWIVGGKKKKNSTITPKWRRGNKHACALTMVNFQQTCGRYSWINGLLGYAIRFNLFYLYTKLHLSKQKLNAASLAEFS